MIEHARSLTRGADPVRGRNLLREYLQARALEGLQQCGAFGPLAFHGGTALRFLFGLPRFSEDLDFALERTPERLDLERWTSTVVRSLGREGYDVAASLDERRTVRSAWIRFPGVLHEVGLSAQRGETLAIKLEVDTNPPAGAGTGTRLVRRHVPLRLHHHDRSSLFAGKLHAVLCRPWAKGRDLFDLIWYLSDPDWPPPNLALLNAARRQTDPDAVPLTPASWRAAVAERVRALRWDRLAADVRPFLERAQDAPRREDALALLLPG